MINRTRIMACAAMLSLAASALAAQQPGTPMPHARPEHMRMMDSMTTRLDSLVARMNAATGEAKVSAMAAVINELVAQRRAMHAQMTGMMDSRRRRMSGQAAPDSAH